MYFNIYNVLKSYIYFFLKITKQKLTTRPDFSYGRSTYKHVINVKTIIIPWFAVRK